MEAAPPEISVVIATRDRPARLAAMLDSLRAQTVSVERFEVVVVDDSSTDDTERVVQDAEGGGLRVRLIRRGDPAGPGAGRNTGWREAAAPLVAFTDDDCVARPNWIATALERSRAHPGAVVEGWVGPDPSEEEHLSPFAYTSWIDAPGAFATMNIVYPRKVLERVDGFDETFRRTGEDTDLGYRALESGATSVFAPEMRVYHAVLRPGVRGLLRKATVWTESPLVFKRHPQVRRRVPLGIFWRHHHWLLARAAIALLLPRWLGPLRLMLAAPYLVRLTGRRSGPLLAPWILLLDLLEVSAIARGAIRYRTFLL